MGLLQLSDAEQRTVGNLAEGQTRATRKICPSCGHELQKGILDEDDLLVYRQDYCDVCGWSEFYAVDKLTGKEAP